MDKVKVLFENAHAVLAAFEPVRGQEREAIVAATGAEWKIFFDFIERNFDSPVEQDIADTKVFMWNPSLTEPGLPLENISVNAQPVAALRFLLVNKGLTLEAATPEWNRFAAKYHQPIMGA